MTEVTLEQVRDKAREVFAESRYQGWPVVFDELNGKEVDREFIDEMRWYTLFNVTYRVGDNYFRVPDEAYADGDSEQEYNVDDVEQVYPHPVTKVVFKSSKSA